MFGSKKSDPKEIQKRISDDIQTLNNRYPHISTVFLVDGSSSITTEHFQLLKYSILSLTQRFKFDGNSCTGAVVQFSTTARTEMEFTTSRFNLTNGVDKMQQMNGGTNTQEGLKHCLSLLQLRADARHKILFLITDGYSDSDPVAIANELKEKFYITILCIGIGPNVKVQELERVASNPNCVYLIPSMDDLKIVFPPFVTTSYQAPIITLDRTFVNRIRIDLSCAEAIDMYIIEIFLSLPNSNSTERTWKEHMKVSIPNPKNPKLEGIMVNNLPGGTKLSIRCCGRLLSSAYTAHSEPIDFETLPETPEVSLIRNETQLKAKVQSLIKEIKAWRPPKAVPCANIYLLGVLGAAKSTIVNTWWAALNEEFQDYAITGSSHASVTKGLTEYPFEGCGFSAWDTFGWQPHPSENFYSNDLLSFLLAGQIKEGFEETHVSLGMNDPKNKIYLKSESKFSESPHGFALVFPAISSDNAPEVDRLQKIQQYLQRNGQIQCVILWTKVDQVDTEIDLLKNPELIFESEMVHRYMREFLDITRLPSDVIFPIIGTTGAQTGLSKYVRDYLSLRALKALLYQQVTPLINRKAPKNIVSPPTTPEKPIPSQTVPPPTVPSSESTDSPRRSMKMKRFYVRPFKSEEEPELMVLEENDGLSKLKEYLFEDTKQEIGEIFVVEGGTRVKVKERAFLTLENGQLLEYQVV